MSNYNIKDLLAEINLIGTRPNKKLGQNFLINKDIAQKISMEALKNNPNRIVEVGPGLGALTNFFLSQKEKLLLIELDRFFVHYWEEKSIQILHQDALKLNWNELQNPPQSTLVSNLPYQISSSLVIERSIFPTGIERMVLMFQKEVGQRILAKEKTKDYGLLTVIAQSFWEISHLCDVGPKDFYPPPQVASRVLVFDRKPDEIINPEKFLELVKRAFSQRRKFMISSLSQIYPREGLLSVYGEMKIKESARAEELSVKDFQMLYGKLCQLR